ncbi:unnamed protein product [Arabidopsis arenosa]|uniref:Uncharacterized protein n=1 Tax=Arabidopsis arenosa TaxID=38785 RepID=A0A8S1ZGC8_ARAAE|nr:unnamed protein product [Arabidopsis arenosa]
MITRSNLAEQLREYQIRSKHDWASVSFFSSTSSFSSSSRVDVVVFVIWELVILAFFVFSAVSLYFKRLQLAFILICVTLMLLICMKVTKQVSHKTHLLVLRTDPIACLMDEDDGYAHGTGRVRPGWLSRAISGFRLESDNHFSD